MKQGGKYLLILILFLLPGIGLFSKDTVARWGAGSDGKYHPPIDYFFSGYLFGNDGYFLQYLPGRDDKNRRTGLLP